MIINKIKNNFYEIKNRIFLMLIILLIFRIGSFIPIFTIKLKDFNNENNILNILNIFSGGILNKISLFTIGIVPYISSSIIMQIFFLIKPNIYKSLNKENIIKYTKLLTILLSVFQSIGILINIPNFYKVDYFLKKNIFFYLISILIFVTGAMILMWLSDQINERGIGNGISFIIFTSILSKIPNYFLFIFNIINYNKLDIIFYFFLIIFFIFLIYLIIFIECSQRCIIINYANRCQSKYNNIKNNFTNYLPIKINNSGIIPIIFSSSIMLFIITLLNWLKEFIKYKWFINIINLLQPENLLYHLIYIIWIIFFNFFYTSLIFNSKKISNNFKKNGAYIEGIRPGKKTFFYINKIINFLTFISSLYIILIYLIPKLIKYLIFIPFDLNLISILIIIIVVIDIINQIQTLIISNKYKSIFKKIK